MGTAIELVTLSFTVSGNVPFGNASVTCAHMAPCPRKQTHHTYFQNVHLGSLSAACLRRALGVPQFCSTQGLLMVVGPSSRVTAQMRSRLRVRRDHPRWEVPLPNHSDDAAAGGAPGVGCGGVHAAPEGNGGEGPGAKGRPTAPPRILPGHICGVLLLRSSLVTMAPLFTRRRV